jgi:MerR family transcriptional regulator, light-induced transcriptional regulator
MMRHFSIAELEQYTRIKAHTFRTWEQRYPLTKSKRTETGLRYYSLDDLDFFLDFSLLNRYGYKVSKLAQMGSEEIREKAFQLQDDAAKKENIVHRLIIDLFSLETDLFESTLNHAIIKYGIDEVVDNIILPFIERIDLLSYTGNSATEYHFAVTILRKKIIVGIEQAKSNKYISKTALLFLPEGEHFDLILLYIHYKLQLSGVKSFYLGTNIQLQQLSVAIQKKRPDLLITYLHNEEKKPMRKLLDYLPSLSGQLLLVTERSGSKQRKSG